MLVGIMPTNALVSKPISANDSEDQRENERERKKEPAQEERLKDDVC